MSLKSQYIRIGVILAAIAGMLCVSSHLPTAAAEEHTVIRPFILPRGAPRRVIVCPATPGVTYGNVDIGSPAYAPIPGACQTADPPAQPTFRNGPPEAPVPPMQVPEDAQNRVLPGLPPTQVIPYDSTPQHGSHGNPPCGCPDYHEKILARLDKLAEAVANIQSADNERIMAKLEELATAIANIQTSELDDVAKHKLEEMNRRLNDIERKIDGNSRKLDYNQETLGQLASMLADMQNDVTGVATVQVKEADAVAALAAKNAEAIAKLDAAVAILEKGLKVTLNVQSPANLPASYVDTSTIWAVQRQTGISHIVLVVNSKDPEWPRLETSYKQAAAKFPAMQLLDIVAEGANISPTPQMVIYYKDGREPAMISGDREVADELRKIYTN